MSVVSGISRLDLAGLIAKTLKSEGIDVVLTGGSCVSIYSNERYVSMDLDFIDVSLKTNKQIGLALKTIGFESNHQNSRYFAHPDTHLTVEFPSAPLTIGDEFIPSSQVASLETAQGTLRLLSPTDCVKDRLANYYYFRDRQCLDQALMVAAQHPINLVTLKEWHENEKQSEQFLEFVALMKKQSSAGVTNS